MAENPFYRFFRRFDVAIPFKKWERLPRLPGYKNEYWDGAARYTPRPRTCDVYLDLGNWSEPPPPEDTIVSRHQRAAVRKLRDEDWAALPEVFHGAFAAQPPLSGWGRRGAARASRVVVRWTRDGHDGPLVRDACFVAWTGDGEDGGLDRPCGAALVTLVPAGRLRNPPKAAAVPHPEQAGPRVVPHLDWIFVGFWMQRHGIGTMLLESVVAGLRARGFCYLASTCLLDNTPSLLWHWRNGFHLPTGQWVSTRVRRVT